MAMESDGLDFTAEVGRQANIRLKGTEGFQAALTEARARAAIESAEAPQAPAAGQPQQVQSAVPAEKAEEGPGFMTEAWRAAAGAVVDAGTETVSAWADYNKWFAENLWPVRFLLSDETNKEIGGAFASLSQGAEDVGDALVADNETTAGKVTRSIGQFLVPYLGAVKALKVAQVAAGATGKVATAARPFVAGAITDAAAFDPHEKRLANLIMEWTENDPAFGQAFFEYLQADPSDTAMEGRLKNAVEGLALGGATELAVSGLMKSFRVVRDHYSRGGANDPLEALAKAADEHKAETLSARERATTGTETKATETMYVSKTGAASTDIDKAAADTMGTFRRTDDPEDFMAQLEAARARLKGDAPTPKAPDPEPAPRTVESFAQNLDAAVEAVESRASNRRAWVNPKTGETAFDAPVNAPQGYMDFDAKVKAALEADPATRTAEDLIALREYRRLQEAAFKPLVVVRESKGTLTDAQRKALTSRLITPEGTKGKPMSDGDRIALREDTEALVKSIHETAEAARVKMESLSAADKPIFRGRGVKLGQDQGGFISPTVLMHMAAAGGGGLANMQTLDDDATTSERIAAFLEGAGAGLAVSVGGVKVADRIAKSREAMKAAQRVADDLARPLAEGVVPAAAKKAKAVPKPAPAAMAGKADEMVKALMEGRTSDLAKALDEADFNLARMDTTEEMDEVINAFSKVFDAETLARTRGVEKFADTVELAKDLGVDAQSLAHLSKDSENLSSRVFAHRAFLAASAAKVTELARIAAKNPGDTTAVLALRKQVALHGFVQTRMKGITTEIGRALSQFRIQAPTTTLARQEVDDLVTALGGAEVNKEFAQKLAEIADPRMVNSVARNLAKRGIFARTQDALFEVWVNGILGGFSTHVVNIVGNASVAGLGLVERGIAGLIGGLRHGDDVVRSAEVVHAMQGMREGLMDVLRINSSGWGEIGHAARLFASGDIKGAEAIMARSQNVGDAWKAFAQNTPRLDSSAHQSAELLGQTSGLSASNFGLREGTLLGKTADYLGAIHRTFGGRLLTTSDEIFKTMLYRGELRAQAYREATRLGLSGDDYVVFVKDALENPTPEMSEAALAAARRGTFTTPLGKAGRALTTFVHATPGLRFIAPFVRTPLNIMKFVGERTPILNLASETVRADLAAGGVRRDMAIARSVTGGMLFLTAGLLKEKGLITGGGDTKQSAERLGGEQQYSLRIGDTQYSFNRLDPIGMFLGLTADIYDLSGQLSSGEMDNMVGAAMTAVQRNLVSRSYVKGIMDIMLVAADAERYGERFVQRFVASWMPNYIAQFTKVTDGEMKEVWTVVDAIKARTPGWSDEVLPAVNQLGEDVHYTNGLGPDLVSIIRTSKAHPSPLARELVDLNADLERIARKIDVQGTPGIDLSPQQYYRLSKLAGERFKELGEKLVGSAQYQRLPQKIDGLAPAWEESREKVLKRLWSASIRAAKMELIKSDKELKRLYENAARNRASVLTGRKPTLPLTLE